MTLPEKALFTIKETGEHLALSRASVYRLIDEAQLTRVYPRPGAARITRESLAALLEKAQVKGAVRSSIVENQLAKEQAAKVAAQVQEQDKKKSLADRWGLTGLFGKNGEKQNV